MLPKIPFEELIHALEGYDNHIFKTSPDLLSCYLHPAQIDQIKQLIGLADLYCSIDQFIRRHETASHCRYQRCLLKGTREALREYKRQVRSLENELADPCLSLTAFNKVLIYSPLLQGLLCLLEMSVKSSPVEVLDKIYNKCCSSDQLIKQSFATLAQQAFKPFWDDIWFWMIFGHLSADLRKGGKFFIEEDESGKVIELNGSQLPVFLSQNVCSKIYFAGKVVRGFSSDDQLSGVFDAPRRKELHQKYRSIVEKPVFEKLDFEQLVEEIRTICAKVSIQHVIQNENLGIYLKMIKDFVLAGNEDLLGCFINNLQATLQKKPNNKKKLEKGVILSLSNTLMDFFNSEKLEHISDSIKIHLTGVDDPEKWPTINIEFAFPATIRTVIKDHHLAGYNKIFNFCLHLYRAKKILTDCWLRLVKDKNKRPVYWFLLHRLILIIGHLYYFYKVNVIERLYFEFSSKVESCQDIEILIEIHHQFVVRLVSQSLLDIEAVGRTLNSLLRFIDKACSFMEDELTSSEVSDLETELAQLCSRLDYLFTSLKSYSICPTLSHLIIQLHKSSQPA